MFFYYSDHFDIPLPEKHRFPGSKYSKLRSELLRKNLVKGEQLLEAPRIEPSQLLNAHCPRYVEEFLTGTLCEKKMKRIGFPWSEHLVQRTLATQGGALAAARSSLEYGLSGQLAGGTHHAHYDYGAGYCIFNDFAVIALEALKSWSLQRVAIIDLDVHQGDGNADLLKENPHVFVLSLHGEKNFPFRKFESDLDIALKDGCEDQEYLRQLELGLEAVTAFRPDLVLYQCGVDILKEDKLGRLNISLRGLKQRDQRVLETFYKKGIPVCMAIGGGYADPIDLSVAAYVQTYEVAQHIHKF